MNPPAFQPQQNYYNSPIITNPPLTTSPSANYGIYDPYNYQPYNNLYNNPYSNTYNNGGCGCSGQNYGNYPGCYGQVAPYGGYGNCGCGYQGYTDCSGYGFPVNKDRLTPKFPSKLGHSFVTSGQRVQNKLVINQPTLQSVQSAPFQTQRRKTYVPYTRKYIQYQDYIQYIPVQKSEWQYQKVMKQIDYVPQQYYESSYEYLPRERVQHKVKYLPIEQQIVHVPEETVYQQQGQSLEKRSYQTSAIRQSYQSIAGRHKQYLPQQQGAAVPQINPRPQQVINGPVIVNRLSQQQRQPTIIHPAESTVQMVPHSRLRAGESQVIRQSSQVGVGNQGYQFPPTGGVVIGSYLESQNKYNPVLDSFGPRQINQLPARGAPVESSRVVNSVLNGQSGNSESEIFNQGQRNY